MARRLRIGIDVDNVIVDFVEAFREQAQITLGRSFLGHYGDWNFSEWRITSKEQNLIWKDIKASENWFYANCFAYKDVPACLADLTNTHDCFFITTRIETAGDPVWAQTARSLAELGVRYPQVIVTKEKGKVVSSLGLDAFIDDRLLNLQDIWTCNAWDENPPIKLFIRNASHNQTQDVSSCWVRVDSFSEFVEKIDELGK